MKLNNIRAVIFDLDDTLLNRRQMFGGWACDFIKSRTDLPNDTALYITSELLRFERRGSTPRDEVFSYFERRLSDFGAHVATDEMVKSYRDDYRRYSVLFDDAAKTLTALRERGFRLGIITNGYSLLQGQKIKTVGLSDYVDEIIISEDAGIRKPHPDIFRLCASRLGCDVSECVYVGDYVAWDIEGPLSAGMNAFFYRRNIFEDEYCDYQPAIDRLYEITELLDKAGKERL